LDVLAISRADFETAIMDLGASPEQAFVVAVHAMAWRLVVVLLPVGCVVGLAVLMTGVSRPLLAALPACVAIVGPLGLAIFGTFPVAFVAAAQTFYRGSTEARIRFGASGSAYLYYGWRYAFRGRQRPWGAMTMEEKRLSNPRRAAIYWPEMPDT
jgi:hypothetical protein